MSNKKLTTWEAACIITGYGVGGGVLSMPYLAEKAGLLPALAILVISFLASYILHLMIADLALKTSEGGQIIACLSQFLFRGKVKKILSTLFFVLMTLILFTNLAAYISGSEEIIVGLLPIPSIVATLLIYFIAASVVLLGLKAVGISEKISVAVIFGLIGALGVASFFATPHALPLFGGSVNGVLAFYGMAMFAMATFFSVPQTVEGLNKDKKQIKRAVFLGLFNNFIIIVIVTCCALLASDEVTEVAMVGWSAGIGCRRNFHHPRNAHHILVLVSGTEFHRAGADEMGFEAVLAHCYTSLTNPCAARFCRLYGIHAYGRRSDIDHHCDHDRTRLFQRPERDRGIHPDTLRW